MWNFFPLIRTVYGSLQIWASSLQYQEKINRPAPPLPSRLSVTYYSDLNLEFEEDQTSKQSSQLDFYCDLCCKKFMSAGTYKQHLNSKRHKGNREKIKCSEHTILSRSSSSSDFSILGGEKAELCFFCYHNMTCDHLKN